MLTSKPFAWLPRSNYMQRMIRNVERVEQLKRAKQEQQAWMERDKQVAQKGILINVA